MLTQDELQDMEIGDIYTEAQIFETKQESRQFITRRRNSIAQVARRAGVLVEFFNHCFESGKTVGGVVVCRVLGDAL